MTHVCVYIYITNSLCCTPETNTRCKSPLKVKVKPLSRVRLSVTPWTVAYQASPSMGFSRQQYWSGLPFPSPGDLPDQGSNPGLMHCRQTLYTVKVTNRFKGLDLIDRVPEELWMEVHDIVQEAVIKTIPKKKKCKKAKWLTEQALQIAE